MGMMRTIRWTASAVVCLALSATGASAHMNTGGLPQKDIPIGLGMPKPKPDAKTAYQQSKELIEEKKYAEAVPLLQAVVIDDPRNDDAWHDLAFANQELGHTGEAIGYYERALAIRPVRKDTRSRLGALQLALDNLPKAEEQVTELKRLCTTGCDELKNLEVEIAAYKATPHISKREIVR